MPDQPTNSQMGVLPPNQEGQQLPDVAAAAAGAHEGSNAPATLNTTPVTPNAPPPTEDKSKIVEVQFSDFQEMLGETPTEPTENKKGTDKDESTLPPNKVLDESKEAKDKGTEQQKEQPVQGEDKEKEAEVAEVSKDIRTGKKDYTGIDPADHKAFSAMSQRSFDYLKPIYLRDKQQRVELEAHKAEVAKLRKGAIPENYYEHPNAYTLTPEFENAARTYSKAEFIANHWNEQLEKVRAGDDTYREIHIDAQTGKFYYSEPVVASKASEGNLIRLVEAAKAQMSEVNVRLDVIAKSHGDRTKQDVATIKEFENISFPAFNTEEGKKNLAPIVKDTLNKILPPSFHSNPLAEGYVKSLIMIRQLGGLIKELQSKVPAPGATATGTTAPAQQSDKAKAGPTNASMAAGGGNSNKGVEVTMDDFSEVMGRR
jgi:hypothetical protein